MAAAGGHWLKINYGAVQGVRVFVGKNDTTASLAVKIAEKSGKSLTNSHVKNAAKLGMAAVSGVEKGKAELAAKVASKANAPKVGGSGFETPEQIYGTHAKIAEGLGAHFEGHGSGLTANQAATLYDYQGAGYIKINKALWNAGAKPTAKTKQQIADLDAVMAKSPGLPKDMVLSRSATSYHPLYKVAKTLSVGDTYTSKGFDSTGTYSHSTGGGGVLVRFNAPKGTKGFFMQAKGYQPRFHELEYLLPRNLSWKVVGKSTNEGGTIILDLALGG